MEGGIVLIVMGLLLVVLSIWLDAKRQRVEGANYLCSRLGHKPYQKGRNQSFFCQRCGVKVPIFYQS